MTAELRRTRPRGFAPWTPRAETLALVQDVRAVLDEYHAHLPLSGRQVFYRLVALRDFPKTETAYARLCEAIARARRAGLLPFEAIRDDGAVCYAPSVWEDAADFLAGVRHDAGRFRLDRQAGQPARLWVLCEAGGMAPMLAKVANPFGVPVHTSSGFDSLTAKHDLAQELAEELMAGGKAEVLHLGDLDPSGVHLFMALAEDVVAMVRAIAGAEPRFTRLCRDTGTGRGTFSADRAAQGDRPAALYRRHGAMRGHRAGHAGRHPARSHRGTPRHGGSDQCAGHGRGNAGGPDGPAWGRGMIGAEHITRALRGKWYQRYGLAFCPAHDNTRTPALRLADGDGGRLLALCSAGCSFAEVLDALRSLALAEGRGGQVLPDAAALARRRAADEAEAIKREAQALAVWRESMTIAGTLGETYLRHRGITCDLPATLRFHPHCWHPSARRIPAMVGLVEGSARLAVHRTYLREDGEGKADATPTKAMLGTVAGGAVRLIEGGNLLAVAEGLETALSLACGLLDGPATVWAALSASGLAGLSLPPCAGRLVVAVDGDNPGREVAHVLATRAHALGWSVALLPAPAGQDWNDVLRGGIAA